MKFLLPVLLVFTLAYPPSAALAQPGGHNNERSREQAQQRNAGAPGQSQRDSRENARPPQHDRRADGRLSQEERQELRRDIDRANREIYKK